MKHEPALIVETFNARRAELATFAEDTALYAETIFAVGLLMGAAWPGAAAAVSNLVDARFGVQEKPWSPVRLHQKEN
jgi:hypothetical protein